MNNESIQELRKYHIRIDWSEENNGDCDRSDTIEAKNINEVWDSIFNDYVDGHELHGEWLDSNMFSWTEYYSKTTDKMVYYNELTEEDKTYNEYDELDIYYKTYTISVYNEEEEL